MDSKKKISVSWSGGKDSAFALYKLLETDQYEIVHLHTVIVSQTKRVGLHGIHENLIDEQAEVLGLKVIKLYLDSSDDHAAYEQLMQRFYKACAEENIVGIMFGDIFLEDLKAFRERLMSSAGIRGIYPLWRLNTAKLVHDFIEAGFKTIVCAANKKYFGTHDLGKTIDKDFLEKLSSETDPCGENGEFHTFVYDGPIFKRPIAFSKGAIVEKTYEYKVVMKSGEIDIEKTTFLFQEIIKKDS
jgi:uncharacterized protein (TIGR00290 family)